MANDTAKAKTIRITLVKSPIGYEKSQGATARALGLTKLHKSVEKPDNDAVRGMIYKINHLVRVEEA
ncbi:MAG: 50S ribosomal protein L30 [Anaerolineae bacterium]|nr:50S ribosomal protein L30 [Anaerolineae bacterium]